MSASSPMWPTTYHQPLVLLRNGGAAGRAVFTDVSKPSGVDAVGSLVGRGLAVGDRDNDGRVDAVVVDSEGSVRLLHNETEGAGHWLSLKLEGTGKVNRSAHGALVTVKSNGKTVVRHCQSDGSYMSVSDSRVHVGLGVARDAEVTVQWPGGPTKSYGTLTADRVYTLRP